MTPEQESKLSELCQSVKMHHDYWFVADTGSDRERDWLLGMKAVCQQIVALIDTVPDSDPTP
jgi:hypothetical protein